MDRSPAGPDAPRLMADGTQAFSRPAAFRLPLGAGERRFLMLVGDLVLAAVLVRIGLLVGAARSGWTWSSQWDFLATFVAWVVVCGGLWTALAWADGQYDRRRMGDRWTAAVGTVKVSGQVLVLWALAYFVLPPWTLVRHVLVFFAVGAATTMPLWRLAYGEITRRPGFRRRLLIVGTGAAGRELLAAIRREVPWDFEVIGFVDTGDGGATARSDLLDGVPVLGTVHDLAATARRTETGAIALAAEGRSSAALLSELLDAREQGISVVPMPVIFERITGRVPVDYVAGDWLVALPLDLPEARGLYPLARRMFDLGCAMLGAAVLLVLLPVVAPLVRWTSEGPLFLKQERVGQGGRPFTLWKLRTMVVDAEPDGPVWAAEDDPRVTVVGRWLRRTGLDELPQVFNILRGEMSVIGPRPERPEMVARLAREIPFYRMRHAVRPGLTGWATVQLGYTSTREDAQRKLEYDLYGIKHRSALLDLQILLRTAASMLRMSGR